jgi:hypothetical protein
VEACLPGQGAILVSWVQALGGMLVSRFCLGKFREPSVQPYRSDDIISPSKEVGYAGNWFRKSGEDYPSGRSFDSTHPAGDQVYLKGRRVDCYCLYSDLETAVTKFPSAL